MQFALLGVLLLSGTGSALGQYVYHTYPEIEAELLDAETDYPQICRRHFLGRSYQGRDMWALCISDNVGVEEDEPEFRYISTMHGDEVTGVEMCLYFIDYLTTNYGSVPRVTNMVDSIEVWIVPCMNPDGFVLGRRGNARGYDLNRNFPDPFSSPANTTAGREVETGNIMNWSFGRSFTLAANYHGGALVANYPFDTNASSASVYTPTPDDDLFIWISKEYSQHNLPMWNSFSFPDGITNGADWYAISGGMQDWSYVYHGCNEITIEVSNVKTPPASQMPGFWEDNRESMLAYVETCLIGVRGIVTDAVTGDPLAASVTVVGRDHAVYTDPDVGDYHRMLLPGTYDLTFEAPGHDPQTEYDITVSAGDATRLDVTLPAQTALTYPNGGEVLEAGTETTVTWTGNPDAQFQVQYTANAGDISSTVDGFETGSFDPAYDTGGHRTWIVTDTDSYVGQYAARSGDITHSQATWLTRTVAGGNLSFRYRVSSEAGWDFFNFYIDSERLLHASGTSGGWTQYSTTLSPGPHELKWEYTKDSNTTNGSDAAWIDELEISTDNTTWTDIIALTAVGAVSTPWTPVAPSADYLVRTRSYYGAGTYGTWDQSDSTFTVSAGPVPGDFDWDGDVDTDDYDEFALCFTGAGGGPIGPACLAGDFDMDDDIDCDDWDGFTAVWTGPGQLPGLVDCPPASPLAVAPPHDARKNRYISVNATGNPYSVALRVDLASMTRCAGDLSRACGSDTDCPDICSNDDTITCDTDAGCGGGACVSSGPCVEHPDVGLSWWVQQPEQIHEGCIPSCTADDWIARVAPGEAYSQLWTLDTLHIGDCEIIPVATYEIRACLGPEGIACSDPFLIGTIVQPLIGVGTVGHYGDVVGPVDIATGQFTPPDGVVNVVDVQGHILTKQNYGLETLPYTHPTWMDLEGGGPIPQYILNASDLLQLLKALQGDPYSRSPVNSQPGECGS